ncbi:MAG: hypothetical protein GY944_07485 [bacterium]|nr:hypothetical protein [bacterium]
MPDKTRERRAQMLGAENVHTLQTSLVAVIGVGLLGGGVVSHFAQTLVPQLLVDCGIVDEENLCNQSLPAGSVGERKAEVRCAQAKTLSPRDPVHAFHARIEDLGMAALRGVALLVTGLDSRASRVRVAEISHRLGIPWIDMAIDGTGESLHGTVTCWDPRVPDAGCYACRYDEEQFAQIRNEGQGPGCPSWGAQTQPATPPTLMASGFGAVVSGLGVTWAMRVLLGGTAGIANKQLHISGDPVVRTSLHSLAHSSRCPLPHEPFADLAQVADEGVAALWARASRALGALPSHLQFHHRVFVSRLYCPTCGKSAEGHWFAHAIPPAALRCPCQPGALFVPSKLQDRFCERDVARLGFASWHELGLPAADVVTAAGPDQSAAHFIVGKA